jgi:hypothetical protein
VSTRIAFDPENNLAFLYDSVTTMPVETPAFIGDDAVMDALAFLRLSTIKLEQDGSRITDVGHLEPDLIREFRDQLPWETP